MDFAGFEWDVGNLEKCLKHGVTISEIESLFRGVIHIAPDVAHSIDEDRFKAIGTTSAGRNVLVVFTLRSQAPTGLFGLSALATCTARRLSHMKKKLPDLRTDAEAETFVSTADLSEYDLSTMVPIRFTLKPSSVPVSVELPKHLVDEARSKADRAGIPFQDFIQSAIERAILD